MTTHTPHKRQLTFNYKLPLLLGKLKSVWHLCIENKRHLWCKPYCNLYDKSICPFVCNKAIEVKRGY